MSSFPKHSTFYKLIATLVVILIVSSMAIIAIKRCHLVAVSEQESKELKTATDISDFISKYFIKLHILHIFSLVCSSAIIVLAFIDLVPHHDEDLNFAFHFISVFVIAIIGLTTLYASYVAYEKPCTTPPNSSCCSLIVAPKLFESSGRPPVTAFTQRDSSMIAVIVLDSTAALLLLITSLVYFIDMRNDAKNSGYLSKVHNSNYLSKY